MKDKSAGETDVYKTLVFPDPPVDRPYALIDMVATIDGKILSGTRNEHVLDLGSKVDHVLMNRIAAEADAIIVGAQTLRASPSTWIPKTKYRIVVSSSGDLPYDSGFFKGGSNYVATTNKSEFPVNPSVKLIRSGECKVEFPSLFNRLRNEIGIRRVLVLGGSELNAQLLSANLIDELFVTIAPKIKLGRDIPTYADGEALSREHLQSYSLIEHHVIGNEIFIRYRRETSAGL